MSEETLSPEELAEFREFQKKKAAAAAEQKRRDDREAYAQLVDETIAECIPQLVQLSETIGAGKRAVLDTFKKVLDMKAAVIPTKRDGQFSHTFTNSDSTMRITIGQNMLDAYRDTAEDGIAMVKEYLSSLAKDEKSQMLVDGILRLLAKDQKGTLKASRVIQLRKMAEESGEEKFIEGVRIIEEAYNPATSSQYIRAEIKDEKGAWKPIPLNMTDC